MRNSHGFSLVELLVVVAILAVIMGVAMPAVSSTLRGSDLDRAGQLLADHLALARAEAASQNADVYVRLIRLPENDESGGGWRGFHVVRRVGTNEMPVSRVVKFPGRVEILEDEQVSPLLFAADVVPDASLPGAVAAEAVRGIRYRPGGALDPRHSVAPLLTLGRTEQGIPGDNFFSIHINGITGKITVYRP